MAQKRSADFERQELIENTPYNRHIVATYARRTAKRLMDAGVDPQVVILKESQLKEMSSEELTDYRRMLGGMYRQPEKSAEVVSVESRYGAFGQREAREFDVYYFKKPEQSRRNVVQPTRIKNKTATVYKGIDLEQLEQSEVELDIERIKSPSLEKFRREVDERIKRQREYDWFDYEEPSEPAPYVENFPDYDTFDYDADSKIEPDEESDLGGFSGTAQGRANVQPTSWYDDETGEITDEKGLSEWMAANIIIENARTVINQFKYYAGPDKSKKHQAEYRNNAYEVEFILDNAIEQMGARHVAMALQEMADNGQSINYEFFYKDKPNTDFYQSLTNALQATADANESLNDMLEADDWDGYDDGEDY